MGHQVSPTGRSMSFWRGRDAMSFQDVTHGLIMDVIVQLAGFPFDATIPPVTVFPGQPDDQTLQVPVCSRSPSPVLAAIGPLASDQFAMPFEDSFWLEDAHDVTQLSGVWFVVDFSFVVRTTSGSFSARDTRSGLSSFRSRISSCRRSSRISRSLSRSIFHLRLNHSSKIENTCMTANQTIHPHFTLEGNWQQNEYSISSRVYGPLQFRHG